MLVDANVWVSAFVPSDAHHRASAAWRFNEAHTNRRLHVPVLFLAEVGGAIARRTGDVSLAETIVQDVVDDSFIDVYSINAALGRRAAGLAMRLRIRGADAIYVALAAELDAPLVTWDQEILNRAAGLIDVRTPGQLPL